MTLMPATTAQSPRPAAPIPDLLSADPMVRVDLAELRQILVFAFATGGAIESFDQAIGRASLPPSGWDPGHFTRDLFLEPLIEHCLRVRIGGRTFQVCTPYLLRAIAQPPRAPAVSMFRRRVLGELASSKELRAEFEHVYTELVRLRSLFCAARYTVQPVRRLEILRAIHEVIGQLANGFSSATSGLSRLRDFGSAVRDSAVYQRLDALLDHEAHRGTVDLRVRIGADGELRTFQIVSVRENRHNPFYSSRIGRWFAKVMLMLRGYRMNGGEVVERLFFDLFTGLEESVALLLQLLGDMEFYLAGLGLRDLAQAKGLSVCFAELCDPAAAPAHEGPGMELLGLFNPLLLMENTAPLPCDLQLAGGGSVVVVTGPNSGGKTRLLQAIALAQLLGEVGLFVPARKARLPRVSGLFVSLLEESRADQPEGQLGMDLMRIRRLFEQLGMGSLVFLDELCSGTNPSEGEEIARLVISLLPELGAQAFVTTHLLQFAAALAQDRPIARLEFLQVELDGCERPTYGFVPGVARTSLAHKTAARLGVTRDELLSVIGAKKRSGAPAASPGAVSGQTEVSSAPRTKPSPGNPAEQAQVNGRRTSRAPVPR